MEGTCMMVVLAIGQNSQEGISKMKLQQESDDTPLQEKLTVLADQIGQMGIASASLTFLALLCHFIYDNITLDRCWFCASSCNMIVGYFIIAVSIVVMAVPEGLPLAVTISLAYSVGQMKDRNNLVRYLGAC
jgi:P-type Ca2+ transporter type 2B